MRRLKLRVAVALWLWLCGCGFVALWSGCGFKCDCWAVSVAVWLRLYLWLWEFVQLFSYMQIWITFFHWTSSNNTVNYFFLKWLKFPVFVYTKFLLPCLLLTVYRWEKKHLSKRFVYKERPGKQNQFIYNSLIWDIYFSFLYRTTVFLQKQNLIR